MDRKYKQHGYMSDDKPKKQEKKQPHDGRPRQEQFGPRTPRMVGTVSRMRCSNCGTVLQPNADPNAKCPRCAFDLHCCKQCRYFDSAARFECMQPVIEQIARKDVKNDPRVLNPHVRYLISDMSDLDAISADIKAFNAIYNIPT